MAKTGRLVSMLVLATAVICGLASTATAYEQTMTCGSFGTPECESDEEPRPVFWPVRCVEYRINNDNTNEFPSDDGQLSEEARSAITDSFRTWNDPNCSDIQLVEGELTDNTNVGYRPDAGFDGNMNLIIWRDDFWPPSNGDASIALTNVTYSARTGRIADVDVEINSHGFDFKDFSSSSTGGSTEDYDIRNAMTHEVGHFVGLDHTPVEAATMFRSSVPGETKKRDLHPDDTNGLCTIYPTGDSPATCDSPDDFRPPPAPGSRNPDECTGGCCCSQTPDEPGDFGGLFLSLAGLLLLRRGSRR